VRLMQVLPFAGEDTLRQLEVNLASVPSVTELLHQGLGPRDITARLLEGIGLSDVPSSSLCPRYCLALFLSCHGIVLMYAFLFYSLCLVHYIMSLCHFV